MEIHHRFVNDRLIIDMDKTDGSFVEDEIDDFIREVLALAAGSCDRIGLNMKGVSYLNSSGLGELIKLKDSLTDEGITLVLIGVTGRVLTLLNMVGVDQFFTIIESESDF